MSREIEILDFAAPYLFTGASAENERLAVLRNFQAPSGCIRIGITNEKDGLVLIVHHPRREIMRGSIFTHHARGNHKDQSTAEPHFVRLPLIEDDKLQRLVQLQIRMLAMGAMRFQIV